MLLRAPGEGGHHTPEEISLVICWVTGVMVCRALANLLDNGVPLVLAFRGGQIGTSRQAGQFPTGAIRKLTICP